MKKVLAILLTVVLVLSMAGAGTAGSLDKDTSSGKTMVTYEVGDSYTVIIPDSIVINTDKTGSGNVGMPTNIAPIIDSEKNVNVYVKSKNTWNLVNDSYLVNYSMTVAAAGYNTLDGAFSSTLATVYTFDPTNFGVEITDYNNLDQIGTLIYSAPSTGGRSQTDLAFDLIGTVPHSGLYEDELTFTVVLQTRAEMQSALDDIKNLFPSTVI